MLYKYIKGGYKPSTCNKFECLYQFLHRTPLKAKEVIEDCQEELETLEGGGVKQ